MVGLGSAPWIASFGGVPEVWGESCLYPNSHSVRNFGEQVPRTVDEVTEARRN